MKTYVLTTKLGLELCQVPLYIAIFYQINIHHKEFDSDVQNENSLGAISKALGWQLMKSQFSQEE